MNRNPQLQQSKLVLRAGLCRLSTWCFQSTSLAPSSRKARQTVVVRLSSRGVRHSKMPSRGPWDQAFHRELACGNAVSNARCGPCDDPEPEPEPEPDDMADGSRSSL